LELSARKRTLARLLFQAIILTLAVLIGIELRFIWSSMGSHPNATTRVLR